MMSDLREMVERAQNVHESIADSLAKDHKLVICDSCGNQKRITANDIAKYLRSGWPTCCGHTMTLTGKSKVK